MAGLKNIIRKQTVHFQYNGRADGFALQKEVGDWCTHVLIPQLEQQLEKFCVPDWHLTLDKLELNATVDETNWQEKIQQQVMGALQEKLAHEEKALEQSLPLSKRTGNPSRQEAPLKGVVVNKKGRLQQQQQQAEQERVLQQAQTETQHNTADEQTSPAKTQQAESVAVSEQKQAALIHFFLQHGYLPWWSSTVLSVPFPQFVQQWLTGTQTTDVSRPKQVQKRLQHIVQQLKPLLSTTIIARLVNHLPGNDFFAFVKLAFPQVTQITHDTQELLTMILSGDIAQPKYQAVLQPVYRYWLTHYIKNSETTVAGGILEQLYQALNAAKPTVKATILQQSKAAQPANPVIVAWQQLLIEKKEIVTTSSEQSKAGVKSKTQPDQVKESQAAANKPIVKEAIEIEKENPAVKAAQLRELEEGIYIENAGGILVAPFLSMLFSRLQLADSGKLIKPDMAALLVQHIVTGQTTISEPELVLPKILCGIDIETAVETHHKITALQKEQTTEMLSSIISHWSVLKNTSVEGLREAFLQRSGKLRLIDNQWLLQVEQKSYDMLLHQLPWNISMVKLPWMKNLLKTEWV